MLTKEAIEALKIDATTERLNMELASTFDRSTALAVHKDFNITDLEKYNTHKRNFRGNMKTQNIAAFAAYATEFKHAKNGSCAFINQDNLSAKIFFDMGTYALPLHCDHTAEVQLPKTAAYRALLDIVNSKKTQTEVAEFIEDWNFLIAAQSDSGDEIKKISLPAAVAAIRKITIEKASQNANEVRNFGTTTSIMENIDIANKDNTPTKLIFTCGPYLGLAEKHFEVRVSIVEIQHKPFVQLRIVNHEAMQEQFGLEFKQIIEDKLPEEIGVFIGTFQPM